MQLIQKCEQHIRTQAQLSRTKEKAPPDSHLRGQRTSPRAEEGYNHQKMNGIQNKDLVKAPPRLCPEGKGGLYRRDTLGW